MTGYGIFKEGNTVREKKSGILCEVKKFIDELYLFETGTDSNGISPIDAYKMDDFELVK